MKVTCLCFGTWAAASLAGVACDRNAQRSPTESVTSAPEGAVDDELQPVRGSMPSATQAITQARCAREQRCNNIGPEKEYASDEACRTRIQAEWRDDLNARECPGGVNQGELNECLQEIRDDDCGNPFDTLGRITACRSSDICETMR